MNEQVSLKIHYHPGQLQVVDDPAKVKIIVKGRRWGLTKAYANLFMERAPGNKLTCLWVDFINSNIDRYVDRYFLPVLRDIPSQYYTWRQQRKELTLFDSKIDFRSADQPERIEGFGYDLIMLNEAGIILNDRYLWENAIRPMALDFNPDILIGGTPKGQNLFFELDVKAQDTLDPKYKNWKHFHFTTYENPFLPKEKIEEMEADLPDLVRRQELQAEFLEDSSLVFRKLPQAIGKSKTAPRLPDVRYFEGVDIAMHVDFTVITVLDEHGNQVYFNRFNKLDFPYQKQLITEVAKTYGARICIDATHGSEGDPVFSDLRAAGLDIIGFNFTARSKQNLVESLMLSFDQEQLKILNEPVQTNELKMFGYDITASGVKYSAPEGKHDDCVMALALANWARVNAGARPEIYVLYPKH